MRAVPLAVMLLGLSGLLPFFWGVATYVSPAAFDLTMSILGPRFVAPFVLLSYGSIILAFMAGVLWGFATRAQHSVWVFYAVSVIPALWAFFLIGDGPTSSAIYLSLGFIGLLGLDWLFCHHKLAPMWWLPFRVMLTVAVVTSLAVVTFG